MTKETPSPENENQDVSKPIPVLSLDKSDLLWCVRNWDDPDIETQIKALTQHDMGEIADRLNDALREDYWSYMGIIVGEFLRNQNEAKDEEE